MTVLGLRLTIHSIYFQLKRTICAATQLAILLIIYHTPRIFITAEENNGEERSQRGMALLNHTYKSLYTIDYPSCLMACMHDSQCTSLNYWWNISQCELNNGTKYSAVATVFIRDISSTYMGLTRQPGVNN